MGGTSFVRIVFVAAVCIPLAGACKGKDKDGTVTYVAQLESAGNKVAGTFTFKQAPGDSMSITADVKGLTKGGHAVHIHANGDCSGGFKKVGPHFMGGMKMKPGMKHAPMGDIGNIVADDKGVSKTKLSSAKLTLADGPQSIAGRAILVHAGPDPGKAGAKIACGVITAKK